MQFLSITLCTQCPSLNNSLFLSFLAPAEFDLPAILSKTPYSLYVSWDPPASPNGRILNYTVLLNGSTVVETLLTASEGFLMYNVTELSPYTEYSVSVEACNSAGCITSPSFADTTSEAGKRVALI